MQRPFRIHRLSFPKYFFTMRSSRSPAPRSAAIALPVRSPACAQFRRRAAFFVRTARRRGPAAHAPPTAGLGGALLPSGARGEPGLRRRVGPPGLPEGRGSRRRRRAERRPGGGAGGGKLAGRKQSSPRSFRFRCQLEAPPPQPPEPRCLKEVRGGRVSPAVRGAARVRLRRPVSPRAPQSDSEGETARLRARPGPRRSIACWRNRRTVVVASSRSLGV